RQDNRIRPSDLVLDVTCGSGTSSSKPEPCKTPRIIEFLNLEDNTMAVKSTVGLNEPLFQPYPSRLCFEGYEPFGQHDKVIFFRNNDSVNRRIKVLPMDSPHFAISGPRSPNKLRELRQSKVRVTVCDPTAVSIMDYCVAPGMEICFVVTFKPQEVRAYSAELVVVTEREKFVVPVAAAGHRAALDFPDQILLPNAAVKSRSSKTLVVRNMGTKTASVTLSCSDPAFGVSPVDALVLVGQSALLEVSFSPERSTRC
ncbi:unnamed protein product, partial [Discosporangium mesarthrocarpum]